MTKASLQQELLERFFSYVDYSDHCWNWTGGLNKGRKGYGIFWNGNKTEVASRWSYKFFVGDIPSGQLICHHCDNPPCVNPFHLYAGTEQDNANDASERGHWAPQKPGYVHYRSKQTHCLRGHEFTKENTGFYKSGSRRCKKCSKIHSQIFKAKAKDKITKLIVGDL